MKVFIFIILWIGVVLGVEEIDRLMFGSQSLLYLIGCAVAGTFTSYAWFAYSKWYDARWPRRPL